MIIFLTENLQPIAGVSFFAMYYNNCQYFDQTTNQTLTIQIEIMIHA